MRLSTVPLVLGCLVLVACSSSRVEKPDTRSAPVVVPSVVGARYEDARRTLSSAGFCVDRVVVLNPDELRAGLLPETGVVFMQQPGPDVAGGVYPDRVTLQMIGRTNERLDVLGSSHKGCPVPSLVRSAESGTWYVDAVSLQTNSPA